MMKKISPDCFISQLYRESPLVSLEDFSSWALNLLKQVIDFDAAIWGTGHMSTQTFHTQTAVGVTPEIFSLLQENVSINPIFEKLLLSDGSAVDMADVYQDEDFYQSVVYKRCFKPFSIERILSSIHIEERSGIFTLLTLYRFDRSNMFSEREKQIQSRLLYHLLSAASHREMIALKENTIAQSNSSAVNHKSALCNESGIYHCVESGFLDILEPQFDQESHQKFPIAIDKSKQSFAHGSLQFQQEKLGDLYRITVRNKNPLDKLSDREKQVVDGICQGSTFKEIARKLTLSPSTVSNHLYRVYLKLGVHSRSELVSIALQNEP